MVRYLTAFLSEKGEQMFDIDTRQVAEQQVATLEKKVLVAELPGILEAYVAVEQWASDRSISPVGSPREIYFADWNAVADDDPACDVALLVAG